MDTTQSQPIIFLLTIYGGIILGLVYDIYRLLRKAFHKGKWAMFFFDALFIITMGAVVALVLFFANQGELRLYTIVGFMLGFALYMAGISPLFVYLCKWVKTRKNKNNKQK